MSNEDEVLTIKEACELLKIAPATINRMLKRGEVPAKKVGASWRFSRSRLLEWLHAGSDVVEARKSKEIADSAPLKKEEMEAYKKGELSELSEAIKKEDFITTAEASAFLGVSDSSIKLWCRSGKFNEAFKRGKSWYLSKSELEAKKANYLIKIDK